MSDITEIMQCLGEIKGKLESIERSHNKTIYALIGIIAAQIGVKILGTDILLDIATAIALVSSALIVGALIAGLKVMRKDKMPLTNTGKSLFIMMAFLFLTQILVYFRDLGVINIRVIYIVRIIQNISIFTFAWFLMTNSKLFQTTKTNVE